MPLVSPHVIKPTVSHLQPISFVMSGLQYEKLKYYSNTVDVRMLLCLVELIAS